MPSPAFGSLDNCRAWCPQRCVAATGTEWQPECADLPVPDRCNNRRGSVVGGNTKGINTAAGQGRTDCNELCVPWQMCVGLIYPPPAPSGLRLGRPCRTDSNSSCQFQSSSSSYPVPNFRTTEELELERKKSAADLSGLWVLRSTQTFKTTDTTLVSVEACQ